ncbi:type II toxin-antitoxin system prevent-host-death family antitoxin [Pseudomonas sp. EKM23D]|jgi:hypothetical protein|uniref:type II toxin-antitoxin system prevent-host-death family antitoxin n=1 Tax=Pseudomonas TaxID=286 RepID=UPI00142DA556|nr:MULTISPECIES: type II toxin-antitoxin system prevent-host-death family antitoxin [Pseudomonas]KAF6687293.1 type II toxin-antitoxin system prevent-host-death family antitoxin [Pseudomonas sp. EKM23D]QKJ73189.1 type II toxin-antitoxin system prevent-host-death family antitoxin [Pseudomonas rhodesiae]
MGLTYKKHSRTERAAAVNAGSVSDSSQGFGYSWPKDAQRRRIGAMKGKLEIPDDFDDPLPDELLTALEGSLP